MSQVLSPYNLDPYGLHLTSDERCPYGLRVLYKVCPEGRILIQEFFGNHIQVEDARILLPKDTIKELIIYILFHRQRCRFIATDETHFHGFSDPERIPQYLQQPQYTVLINPVVLH